MDNAPSAREPSVSLGGMESRPVAATTISNPSATLGKHPRGRLSIQDTKLVNSVLTFVMYFVEFRVDGRDWCVVSHAIPR